MRFRFLCHLPELVCHKNHTPLQQERSEDPDDLTNTEALEKAFEVHVLQTRVHWPPQLNDLNTFNKHQSVSLAGAGSTRGTRHPGPGLSVEWAQRTVPILWKQRLVAQNSREMLYYTIHYQVIFFPESSCVH